MCLIVWRFWYFFCKSGDNTQLSFFPLQGLSNLRKIGSTNHDHLPCLWEATWASWNEGFVIQGLFARQYPSEKHCAFTSYALRLQMLLIPVSALQLSGAGIFIVIIFPWKATKYLGFSIIGKIFMKIFGQLGSWILKKKIQEILQGHFPGTISISWFYSSKPNQHPLQTPYPQQASFVAIGCFHLQLAPFSIIKSFQTTCQYSIAPSQEGLIVAAQLGQRHLNEAYFFKTFGYEQGKQAGWLVDHMQFGNAYAIWKCKFTCALCHLYNDLWKRGYVTPF